MVLKAGVRLKEPVVPRSSQFSLSATEEPQARRLPYTNVHPGSLETIEREKVTGFGVALGASLTVEKKG